MHVNPEGTQPKSIADHFPAPKGHIAHGDGDHMLSFKQSVSLVDFGKALKYFNKLYIIFAGRDASYKEFTDWLVAQDLVNVEPNLADVEKMMEEKLKEETSE